MCIMKCNIMHNANMKYVFKNPAKYKCTMLIKQHTNEKYAKKNLKKKKKEQKKEENLHTKYKMHNAKQCKIHVKQVNCKCSVTKVHSLLFTHRVFALRTGDANELVL